MTITSRQTLSATPDYLSMPAALQAMANTFVCPLQCDYAGHELQRVMLGVVTNAA